MTASYWADVLKRWPEATYTGFYNENRVVRVGGQRLVVRRPLPLRGTDIEPRQLHESEALRAARNAGVRVPDLLHETADALVCSYVDGSALIDLDPLQAFSTTLAEDVADVMKRLEHVPRRSFARWSDANPWHQSTTSCEALNGIVDWVHQTWIVSESATRAALSTIGVTHEVFRQLRQRASAVSTRPFQLCHGDIQPYNIFSGADGYVYLDWELAAWMDPLWDVALHLQRTPYPPSVAEHCWLARTSGARDLDPGMTSDLESFVAVEALKSLVNDTIRYVDRYSTGGDCAGLAQGLAQKTAFASERIGTSSLDADDAHELLATTAAARPTGRAT